MIINDKERWNYMQIGQNWFELTTKRYKSDEKYKNILTFFKILTKTFYITEIIC